MPAPTKRTRTDRSSTLEDQAGTPPPPTPSSSRTNPSNRRIATTPGTPTRPILTRSAATQPATPTHLTRSTSLFAIPSPSTRPSLGSSRGSTLVRTQSTPSIASPVQLKDGVTPGGSGVGGKPGDLSFDLTGSKRWSRGKENIPPRIDEEGDGEASRKRMKLQRARSGSVASVASMRSEGCHRASVAPSSSSSFSRRSRIPSPTPSLSSFTTHSFESITSVDPLDVIDDEDMDVDKTPTKPRPATRRAYTLPTPPPSSPTRDAELDATAERVQLIRMKSDATSAASDHTESVKGKCNPYKHLKSFLRLSSGTSASVDQTIIGRQQEKAILRAYLAGADTMDVGMYISGPPGTGKTALVTALGREMVGLGWQVIELGCMGLKVGDVWRRLGEALRCGRTEAEVQAYLSRDGARTFVILDEIDSLLPPSSSPPPPATSHLLTKLFSLPLQCNTKLVSISNTLDLTLRARLVLPDGLQPEVLPFKAYAGADMIDIVSARIAAASTAMGDTVNIDAKAVELLTKKVEAQNGDLRMCLGVLASAVSLAETEWTKKTASLDSVPLIKVALPQIIKAFNSHTQQLRAAAGSATASTSATGKKIRSVPLQGKMVLISMLVFLSRTRAGLTGCPTSMFTKSTTGEALNTSTLYTTYSQILSHHTSPFPAASESDYRDLLSNLEVLGLISLSHSAGSSGMTRSSSGSVGRGRTNSGGGKIELTVRYEEVKEGLGLGGSGSGKGLAEEEVCKIWEREEAKVQRAREKAQAAAAGKTPENDDPFL